GWGACGWGVGRGGGRRPGATWGPKAPDEAVARGQDEGECEDTGGGQHDDRTGGQIVAVAEVQPGHGGEHTAGGGEEDHPGQPFGQEVGGRGRDDQHGHHQDDADRLQGGHGDQGQHGHQQVVHGFGGQTVGGGHGRVEGADLQLLVQGQDRQEDHGADGKGRPHVRGSDRQDVSEKDLVEVGAAGGQGDQDHPQGEHGGEDDSQGGVVLESAVLVDVSDAHGGQEPGGQCAGKDADAQEEGGGDAWQDGV